MEAAYNLSVRKLPILVVVTVRRRNCNSVVCIVGDDDDDNCYKIKSQPIQDVNLTLVLILDSTNPVGSHGALHM